MFAGVANWTETMRKAGLQVCEPVELYEDPLRQRGARPEHDLLDPEVRAKHLRKARDLPGPDTPNVYHFGTPCTSYCDYALLNNGTRTFEHPEGAAGQETTQELQGNLFAEFTAEMCETAYDHGKEFVVESSMPTGRYPKLWDQECIKRLRRKTGARIVPTHLCQWGLGPSDDPESRYRKGQWNLVSPGLYLYALLLARRCQGGHRHTQLKGGVTGASYPRTREAQTYPLALCRAWAMVIQSAYHGNHIVPRLRAILQAANGHEGVMNENRITFDTSGIERVCGGDAEEAEFEEIPQDEVEEVEPEDRLVGGPEAEGGGPEAEEGGPEAEAAGGGPEAEAAEAEGGTGSSWSYSIQGDVNGPHMWSVWPPRRLRPPTGAVEDSWDYVGDTGRLTRHHVRPRFAISGNQPEDWIGCPVNPDRVNGIRRTTMHMGLGSQVLVDDWREWYAMGALNQQHQWTGHTEFVVIGAGDSEDYEHTDHEDGDEEDPEDEEGQEENPESEEDIHEVSTHTPPSDEGVSLSRSRSRSGGRDQGEGERRVGYASDAPRLERLSEGIGESGFVKSLAEDYVRWCAADEGYTTDRVRKAVARGDELLKAAGSLEAAMLALWKARIDVLGEPLAGSLEDEVKEVVSRDHYSYLSEMVSEGVPWGGVLQFLLLCPEQAEVDMTLPLGELPLDMVWCLFVLCLLELRLRSGGDVTRLASDDGGGLPGDASLHDDMPSLTSDELGEEQVDLTDILYDPFDRPEGEVIRRAGSSSRSRSPRRA